MKGQTKVRLARAIYSLQAGLTDEAALIVASVLSEEPNNAEGFRYRALIALARKDIQAAQRDIDTSLSIEDSAITRYLSGAMSYYRSLPQQVVPPGVVQWPEPIPAELVLRGQDVQTSLDRAAVIFDNLLATTESDTDSRAALEIWKLASLCNNIDRMNEAIGVCSQLLLRSEPNYFAIPWNSTRELGVDTAPAIEKLLVAEAEKRASGQHILILASEVQKTDAQAALGILERNADELASGELRASYIQQRVNALVKLKEFDKALVDVDSLGDLVDAKSVRAAIRQAQAFAAGEDVWPTLEAAYAREDNPLILLEMCEVALARKNWNWVADHAAPLIEALPTTAALTAAVYGLYNAGKLRETAAIFERFPPAIVSGVPAQVTRIRVLSLMRTGNIEGALMVAEPLAIAHPSSDSLSLLAQLYMYKGDNDALARTASSLVLLPDVKPEPLIRLSAWLSDTLPALAVRLWERADNTYIPDELVGFAVSLAHRLKLTQHTKHLIERMQELGSKGESGITMVSQAEAIELFKLRGRRISDVNLQYRRGLIPLHTLCDNLNVPVVMPLHEALNRNETGQPSERTPIFVRHGSRVHTPSELDQVEQWRLFFDITSIVVLGHLDLVDAVAKAFPKRTFVPLEVIAILHDDIDRLLPAQQERIDAMQHVIDLLDSGRIKVIASPEMKDRPDSEPVPFVLAKLIQPLLVTYVPLLNPLTGGPALEKTAEVKDRLVNPRLVMERLAALGRLTPDAYRKSAARLGTQGSEDPTDVVVQLGAELLLYANIAEILADAGILDAACASFRISMLSDDVEHYRVELIESRHRQRIAEWTKTLRDKLDAARVVGDFQALPSLESSAAGELPQSLLYKELLSLLAVQMGEHDVLVCDDRFVNANLHREGGNLVVSSTDLLAALRLMGAITTEHYYDALAKLRAGGAFFVPIAADEIQHHVMKAVIDDGELMETPEMITLRKYLAEVLLRKDLQRPGQAPAGVASPVGEVPYIVSTSKAILDAIERTLSNIPERREAEIRASWILDNLFYDDYGSFNLGAYAEVTAGVTTSAEVGIASAVLRSVLKT